MRALPNQREGFSERIALIMAELSDLAYIRCEEYDESSIAAMAEKIRTANDAESAQELLSEGLLDVDSFYARGRLPDLKRGLEAHDFELIGDPIHIRKTDTQAYVARSTENNALGKVVAIVFRGTEFNKIRDWQTNLSLGDLRLMDENVTFQVHQGFFSSFKSIQREIEARIEDLVAGDDPHKIYIAGHSLGGGLALIATHQIGRAEVLYDPEKPGLESERFGSKISKNSIRACYTFGSPRVASEELEYSIKSPIYRVVNENDLVPRVPPVLVPSIVRLCVKPLNLLFGWNEMTRKVPDAFVTACAWLLSKANSIFKIDLTRDMVKISSNFAHHGDMRHIKRSATSKEGFIMIKNPPLFRLIWWMLGGTFKKTIDDHGLKNYIARLKAFISKPDADDDR
ncbi:MAG: lipase family protein [Verrucomicrobiota bacterium]